MKFKFKVLFILGLMLHAMHAQSQGIGNSPYSLYGFGDLYYNNGGVRNLGMGNTGVAMRNHYFINNLNPAYYANFRKVRLDSMVKMEGGFQLVKRTVASGDSEEKNLGGNIMYLSFAVPMSKTWGMGLGIRPFSATDNSISYLAPVAGNPSVNAEYSYKGDGSLSEIYMAHGVGLTKNLSIGVNASYVFGSLYNTSLSRLILDPNNPTAENQYGFRTRTRYNGFVIKPGVAFRFELNRLQDTLVVQNVIRLRREHDLYQLIGTTHESEYKEEIEELDERIKKLTKESSKDERIAVLEERIKLYKDSLDYNRSHTKKLVDSINGEIRRVERSRFRSKLHNIKDSLRSNDSLYSNAAFNHFKNEHYRFSRKVFFNAGATYNWFPQMNSSVDYEYIRVMAGSNAEIIDSTLSSVKGSAIFPPSAKFGIGFDKPGRWAFGADVTYNWWSVYRNSSGTGGLLDSWNCSLGGEYTPVARKVLHAKTYRVGVQYQQTPMIINNTRVNDFSASIGATIPVGSRLVAGTAILPRLNVALSYGQRGTLDNGLVRDRYVKLSLSLLINDRWFNKRKIH
jgi:hypothetical protein